ncbi:alkane 1-monooxygenase [Prescottella sp. R16]|uniref:alkane 1-monooxygenase n=1 Tax=Prescottella sp. R16 TaxID=3064529 RepID=UPI00272E51A1|nr:alkane 1-monooxygenase [Prescottella sp. R16]
MKDNVFRWRDPKRYLWPFGLAAAAGPFIAWFLGTYVWGLLWGFGGYLFVVVVPLIDAFTGADKSNPPEEAMRTLSADKYYRWCTFAYLPLQYASFFFGFWCIAFAPMTTGEKTGMAITLAVSAAIGINVAHELGHKKPRHEKWLAKIALAQSFYGHFYIEHNIGHHVRVATPEDPASARFGESVWVFFPRAIFGGLVSAVRLESARLQRRGHRFLSVHNDILQSWTLSVLMSAAIVVLFGIDMIPWILLQAFLAMLLLETVNYIEHYGLLRPVGPNGRPGRVLPEHSWNSDHSCSNLFLFHLQRHSDHHANPRRRYQTLRSFDDAPQLPAGYAVMVVLAFVPPLWRRVMDPRVLAHYGGDIRRVNVQPSKRDRILRRYPVPPEQEYVRQST